MYEESNLTKNEPIEYVNGTKTESDEKCRRFETKPKFRDVDDQWLQQEILL